jgi:signal transduction histidine kinase
VSGGPSGTRPLRAAFDDDLVYVAAAAEGVRAGLVEVFTLLRRKYAVAGVEWWSPAADGVSFRLELSTGDAIGPRTAEPLGAAGSLVLVGEPAPGLKLEIARLRPLLHHWWTAERLAEHAARLARENRALEDFAALVAHDVKSSLATASRNDELRESLKPALEIVDSILDAMYADRAGGGVASPAECVQQAVSDLGDIRAAIVTNLTGDFPIPPCVLRVVLRNLLANAVAADARHIHVSALAHADRRALVVDDDGVGLGSSTGYAAGAQLGVALCRRLVARFGGVIELKPRAVRGTRAVIVMSGADG